MAATEQVVVRTLDAFRGQQMDVVIVCSAHAAHIAADPAQRLSLALTRARLCLIVCGQFEELRVSVMKTGEHFGLLGGI